MPAMAIPRKVRRNPRAQVSLVARYRSPTAFEYVEEECHDLSLGGMFIRSSAPAPAGTLIKLECDIGEGSTMIRGVARVVWLRDSPGNGQPAGMGVKFIKLETGGRDAIKGILDQLATGKRDGSQAAATGELLESHRVRRNDALEPAADEPTPVDEAASEGPDPEFEAALDAGPTQDAAAADRRPSVREEVDTHRRPLIYAAVVVIAVAGGVYALSSGPDPAARRPVSTSQPKPAAKAAAAEPNPEPPPPTAAPEPELIAPTSPAVPAGTKYLLDVLTDPGGAVALVGGQSMTTPARFEFEGFAEPVSLELAKNGFETVTLNIDERGFELEEGALHRRLVISLRPTRRAKPAPRPPPGAKAPAGATKSALPAPTDTSSSQARLKAATTCLSRGDNACVIQTLEGKAGSAREQEMLIETYRAVGSLPKAQKAMRAYVSKYPTGDRAATYRQLLQRQDQGSRAR
jgi:Tfp pilus assembly protein PilZ